ncbi:protein wings apart-like [Phymastichus coffea]|uniref:protein wings apart-like n=1 Tax=Phymastichus coffea TaxID=108790 RepID=UPI00273B4427|nr:protein wings apart-like [Phymastichus coffea]
MTSKNCTKSCHRKVNNSVASGNIQFDKLFKENSNRPSAAKSAGTVGKWGITSFTSIRSTNINGRCLLDGRFNHGVKRMKSDNGNQNVQEKKVLLLKKEDSKSESYKPKKFFKSRNILPFSEDLRLNEVRTSFSNSERGQLCNEKHGTGASINGKILKNDNILKSYSETSCKDESKPPIVLRICKGTAKFVSSEDNASGTYRISKSNLQNTSNSEQSIYQHNVKFDNKKDHIFRNDSFTIPSIPQTVESFDVRTTRSKAKYLRSDVSSNESMLSATPQNTDISLTFRKSLTGSIDREVSNYDIVKTENDITCKKSSNINKKKLDFVTVAEKTIYTLTGDFRDNKLPLTKNNELKKDIKGSNYDESILVVEKSESNIKSEVNLSKECETLVQINLNNDYTDKIISTDKSHLLKLVVDGRTSTKNLDQDWGSSDDDSENASTNLNSKIHKESHCHITKLERPPEPTDKKLEKPTGIRKGSIFKTRSTGTMNSNKRRALYKHKWSDNEKDQKCSDPTTDKINTATKFDITLDKNIILSGKEFDSAELSRVVPCTEMEEYIPDNLENTATNIRCDKNSKGFYTVVKNVKKAHQIQESGEFQEFNDDIEYILDTLRENNPNATRCLSAIRLASKCMAPAFRMHVRAHGTVAKFFKALYDATNDQSLALCTATVMFVLSQDRLAMDLDRDCLELMLSLLECDVSHKNALDDCGLSHSELQKNKEKVRQLCAHIQAQGHAKHLNLDNITVGQLAMETLLSLTSKRAGEWFKEELRELGGLEHIIKTITECYRHIDSYNISQNGWNESLLDQLRKVDRCLRVLENVTHMNEENQVYLLSYNRNLLVIIMANIYKLCCHEVVKYPRSKCLNKDSVGSVIGECLLAIVKVFINLTHRFKGLSCGDKIIGSQGDVIANTLQLVLQIPYSLSEDKQFDIMMLALIFLINLIEHSEDNRKLLTYTKVHPINTGSVDALISLFYAQEELALAEEQKTDDILDGKKDAGQPEVTLVTSKTQEEFIEETISKLLQKAGRHMEHTFIGAYVVLLLGYLIMDNRKYEDLVRRSLPDGTFSRMIAVLQKFFNFMNLTASNEISNCGIAATEKVLKFLRKLDTGYNEEEKNSQVISDSA